MTSKILKVFRVMDPQPVEIWLGITALLWGTWLFVLIDLAEFPAYKFMAGLLSDEVWAIIAVCLGSFKIIAACRGTVTAERWLTFMGTLFWGFLVFGTLYSGVMSLAPAVFLGMFLASSWSYLSLSFWR